MDSSKSTKIKCSICYKKISLLDKLTSKCRCENYYCKNHKFADNKISDHGHECSYNYKMNFIKELIKQHMKVVCVKVDKI